MPDLETHIKLVNDKLLQLIKSHAATKKENENLKVEIKNYKQNEDDYKSALYELDQKVSILKAAAGEMTDADQKEFEKRINLYIKEIDKCIGLLSD
jgi:chromosome segregation ATPase